MTDVVAGRGIGAAEAEVRAALAFLTRIPAATGARTRGARTPRDVGIHAATTGAAAFGLVGALVGAAAAAAVVLVGGAAPFPGAVLAVGGVAVLSGGLHLDGLADTADALAVGDPDRAETARRDPRVGAAGAAAIATIVMLDAAVVASLIAGDGAEFAAASCIVAGAGSRAFAALTPLLARGRVRSDGSAAWFARGVTPVATSVALGSALVLGLGFAVVVGNAALVVGLVAALAIAGCIVELLIRLRGALDGDGIGAAVELSFATILLVVLTLSSPRA